jgi:hypothetical protein
MRRSSYSWMSSIRETSFMLLRKENAVAKLLISVWRTFTRPVSFEITSKKNGFPLILVLFLRPLFSKLTWTKKSILFIQENEVLACLCKPPSFEGFCRRVSSSAVQNWKAECTA